MPSSENSHLPGFLRRPEFILGAGRLSQCPPDNGYEVAFAGRSNVGKSSAINAIVGRKSLARTSKTPGRTQQINFFDLDGTRRIVDLPGYGFARVPLEVRRQWENLITGYLVQRESLRGLVVVMDARHDMKDLDAQMLTWARDVDLPVHVLLTKSDKLKRGAAARALREIGADITDLSDEFSAQLFSATTGTGVATARDRLGEWLAVGQ